MNRPFKAPRPVAVATKAHTIDLTSIPDSNSDTDEEPARSFKKRKLLVHDVIPNSPPKKVLASSAVNSPRKPLLLRTNNASKLDRAEEVGPEGYYRVLWLAMIVSQS